MIQFKIFEKIGLIHGISDASFGSMRETRNIKKFLKFLKMKNPLLRNWVTRPKEIIWAEQVFEAKVHICSSCDSGVIKEVDGLISNNLEQIIAIITADCVPILLFDHKNKVAAVLHGSRKSLIEGIIPNAIKKMKKHFESNPQDILVGIGPHIRVCHYWLKSNTYKKLKNTPFKKYFANKRDKVYLDLTKITLNQLKAARIFPGHIEDCQVCTFCSFKNYFSKRKEEETPHIYKEQKPVFMSFISLSVQTRDLCR